MASFTVSENPTVGVPVVFDASTSTGAITSYKWEFEPGQKGEGKTVAHTYEKAGSYATRWIGAVTSW